MSETFTASNGTPVRRTERGNLSFVREGGIDFGTLTGIAVEQEEALREYFEHARDVELGRWRDPEHPNYVVKHDPMGVRIAHVLHEPSLATWDVFEGRQVGLGSPREREVAAVAAAYFAAHPERKPWHDAKNGDIWLLTFRGFEDDGASAWGVCLTAGKTEFIYPQNGNRIPVYDDEIASARRIYPEGDNRD